METSPSNICDPCSGVHRSEIPGREQIGSVGDNSPNRGPSGRATPTRVQSTPGLFQSAAANAQVYIHLGSQHSCALSEGENGRHAHTQSQSSVSKAGSITGPVECSQSIRPGGSGCHICPVFGGRSHLQDPRSYEDEEIRSPKVIRGVRVRGRESLPREDP